MNLLKKKEDVWPKIGKGGSNQWPTPVDGEERPLGAQVIQPAVGCSCDCINRQREYRQRVKEKLDSVIGLVMKEDKPSETLMFIRKKDWEKIYRELEL